MGKIGSQAVNTTRRRGLDLSGIGGASLAGTFDGSETFSAVLWAGDNRAPAATLLAEWDPSLAGNPATVAHPRVRLTVSKDAVGSCTPGTYYLQVLLDPDGQAIPILPEGSTYELSPGPGSGVIGTSYVTLDQCKRFTPWLAQAFAKDPTLQADLAEQLYEARCWVDEVAMARARRILEKQMTRHEPVVTVAPVTISSGVDFGPEWGVSIYPDTTLEAQLEGIADALAADGMVIDSAVRRATAYRTAFLVCDPLYGTQQDQTPWQKRAAISRERSSRLLACTTLKVWDETSLTTYQLAP